MTLPRASWHDTRQVTVCLLPCSLVFGEHCLYTRTFESSKVDVSYPVQQRRPLYTCEVTGEVDAADAPDR